MKTTFAKVLLPLFILISGSVLAASTELGNGTINIINNTSETASIQVDKGWPNLKINQDPMPIPAYQPTLVKVEQIYPGVGTLFILDSKGQKVCQISAGSPGPMDPFAVSGTCSSDKWKVQQVSTTGINVFHQA